jgi:cytochrome c biogenesis protein CcmG/thiol:disulfide interchange protein DsbE
VSPNSRQRASAAAAARQRRNRWWIWGGLAAVVFIAVVVAVAASGGDDDNASAKTTKFETHAVTVQGTPLRQYDAKYSGNDSDPAIGKTIPTATGVSVFDGTPVTLEPNRKPQMLVFVAHWCPHCQAEVPELVTLAKQGVFDGVDVTAVATGTNPAADNYPPSAWLKREGWPFAVMADTPQGTAAEDYGISAYPYFVLVGADGKVAGRATGEVSSADITANIKALKAGTPLPLLKSGASSSS